jgi:hypothetical protein
LALGQRPAGQSFAHRGFVFPDESLEQERLRLISAQQHRAAFRGRDELDHALHDRRQQGIQVGFLGKPQR